MLVGYANPSIVAIEFIVNIRFADRLRMCILLVATMRSSRKIHIPVSGDPPYYL